MLNTLNTLLKNENKRANSLSLITESNHIETEIVF